MTHICDHDHNHTHLADDALKSRLEWAEALCRQRGERMTAPRRRTLELVLSHTGPIKAYDLIEQFDKDHPAKPPTIYRALSFLEEMGLVHRIESLNAFVACESDETAHQAAFLLCRCCGRSEEIVLGVIDGLMRKAKASGFHPERITLEVKGLCKTCDTENRPS